MGDSAKRYIAVDLGVSSGKVVLASVASGAVTSETVHEFPIPSVPLGGNVYWDAYAAYAEVLKGLAAVGARKVSVESVGVDAWGPGIVCVAKDGSMSGLPRICPDVLSASVQAKFFKRMDRRTLYETAGVNVLDSHAALQLFSMRRAKSVALDHCKYLFFIPDAFAYLLTGKRCTGYSSLSEAGLADRLTGKLSKDILHAAKVSHRRFPSIVQPGTKVAKLSEDIATATGLGRIPVVDVSGSSLSSAASILSGTESSHSEAAHSESSHAGSSAFLLPGAVSVLGVKTSSPVVNDQTFEMNFSNEADAGGANLLVKRIAGMDLLARCVAQWRQAGRDYGPEDLARMAREGAATNAQLDPEDPALLFAADAPAAILRFCSLRSMEVPADDAAIVRLVYSSMAEKYGDAFVKLQSVTPFRINTLRLLGEASGDAVLCQFVADECAVPVTAGPADAAVLGNILVQSGLIRQPLSSPPFATVTYTPGL